VHGYGLGLAFFFANYDALLPHFNRIIAVDWLGMGASPWQKQKAKKKKNKFESLY
jgi:pimeloyl-ACP methyl ester carboxylesterase